MLNSARNASNDFCRLAHVLATGLMACRYIMLQTSRSILRMPPDWPTVSARGRASCELNEQRQARIASAQRRFVCPLQYILAVYYVVRRPIRWRTDPYATIDARSFRSVTMASNVLTRPSSGFCCPSSNAARRATSEDGSHLRSKS